MAGIEPLPASESLESPKAENEILWKKTTDQTGFAYSGKNSFKSGEGEFTVLGQGDSFAGSHAYLLLADVPGEKANSGTTLTAKNSEGKQAFVATETRTGGEQEVAVGAGSEFKTVIDQAGHSDFLQLTEPAKRKIAGAVVSVGFTASKQSAKVKVMHGLGATPNIVNLTLEAETGETIVSPRIVAGSRNSTSFEIFCNASSVITATVSVHWQAIG